MKRESLIKARGSKTQLSVSKILGISQKYLSKIELGQRVPSACLLAKFSGCYQEPVEVLFPDIFLSKNTPKSCKNNKSEVAS